MTNWLRARPGLFLKQTGLISETKILPVGALADIQAQPKDELARIGAENLHKAVIIKLNGGLVTSMGMQKAKSLLKVKDDYSFLDIIVRQARHLNRTVSEPHCGTSTIRRPRSETLGKPITFRKNCSKQI